MKCCGCNKEIDTNKHEIIDLEPQWFGNYNCDRLVKIICRFCIKDPKKKEEYRK